MTPFLTDGAKEVPAQKLKISKARDLALFLNKPNVPFIRFIRCCTLDDGKRETVFFEVEVELGQKKVHDIREKEPMAVVFDPEDKLTPEVLALRDDFPVNAPHQNARTFDRPRSLCLDERPYNEQKLHWSALGFVERIREWLRLTARGELHEDDQPLEGLLNAVDETIILPHDFEKRFSADKITPISICLINDAPRKTVLRVYADDAGEKANKAQIIATTFTTPEVEHGVISRQPINLKELHEFCQKARYDLLGELGGRLRKWIDGKAITNIDKVKLMLIGIFPKKRRANLPAEISDIWVFCSTDSIQKIAIALGVIAKMGGVTGQTLNFGEQRNIVNETQVADINILPLRPVFSLSAARAALYNNFPGAVASKIVAIGMGALGSQIFNNMLRSGFGSWTLVDKDILLPHNCARHALTGNGVGYNKTDCLAYTADLTVNGPLKTVSIPVDVFDPGDREDDLKKAFAQADLIFDFSASIPVAHLLAENTDTKARLISTFLNPKGTDLVVLAEDKKGRFPLIWLEKEYFRFLANQPALAGHLSTDQGALRYSRSCGDISSSMNQNLIALHAAIASQSLRRISDDEAHTITVHCADQENFSVVKQTFEPAEFKITKVSGWAVYVSNMVREKVNALRKERLPNETGGVLIGNFDRERRIIYVVDVLASPPDSTERPYYYVRGTRGLRPEIERIKKVTLSNLDYVGEWHSHPPKCSPSMSNIDKASLRRLAEQMNRGGLPALMLIVAERNRQELFLITPG